MPLSEPMPYRSARALRQLAMVLMVLMGFAFAQTTGNREGKTNFSPASSVEYGSVNLPNLNIEWQLSIRQKLGYFSASLFRENSKWVLWGGNQTRLLTKIEANGGGFLPDFELISPLGIARYENLGVLCGLNKKYGAFEFQEPDGTLHNFSGTICQGVTGTLHDHFGWSIDYPSLTVTSPSGTVFTPSSVTGTNGNAVTKSGAEYIDFSSSNNHPLSVGATYLYYDANGTAQNITPHYGSFILQAKHGCSNVSDSPTASGQLLTQLDYPDGTNVQITYEPTVGAPANVTGRIKTLKLRTGALITYTYNGAHNGFSCEDLGTSGFTRATPDGMWTYVRSLVSGQWVTTVTAPGGQTYTSKFTGTAPYYRVSYDAKESNGSLVQHSYDCYNGNTTGCETVTDLGTSLLTSHFVYTRFGTDTTQTFRTETYFGANQLPTSIRQFDFDGTTRLTATNITYGTYSASGCSPIAGILDHPCTVLVADANNLTMKVDYNTYDANGNLTMNQKLIGNGTYYRTVNTFNPNGTLQKTHLQTGGVVAPDTIYTYGECNGFGFTSVTAGGLTTGQHNDCNGGVPLSVTDANGQSTTFAYNDPLWRKTSSTDPAGNVRNFIYTANSVESKMVYNGGSSVDDVVTTFDTLGRTKLVQKKLGPSSTNYRTVQTNYNSNGQVSSVTRPCSVALGAPCTTYLTTFSYDAIGRTTNVLDQTRPTAGSVSTTYNGRDVLSTLSPAPAGESTKQKRLEFDAIGRLLSVCEITALPGNGTCGQYISSLHGYMTIYAYATNSTDNVVTVTQGSQTRTFHYDKIGRLISESHPESGTTNYTYDTATVGDCGTISSAGDLIAKTGQDTVSTCYTYDTLHRPLSVAHNPARANGSSDRFFVYDTATVNGQAMQNAAGRLARAYTCDSDACSPKTTDFGFSYNVRGEVLHTYEHTPHSGTNVYYDLAQTYRATGLLNSLNLDVCNPTCSGALPTIMYGIDGEGKVTSVSDGTNTLANVPSNGFETDGSVNAVTFSTGDAAAFTYDAPTGRMKSYAETINGTQVKGTYGWNINGTLASLTITNPFNAADDQTCTYSHDDLARITGAHCGTDWDQTFSYDRFGNLTKSGSMSWQPGYSAANNRYTLVGTSYNAKGELTNDTFHTYTWNADGAPTDIDTSIHLVYDPFGRVVEKQVAGVNTEYIYSGRTKLAIMNGQTITAAFIPLPGGTQAKYAGTAISRYMVPDAIGSFRVIATSTRSYLGSAFAPFGEQYAVGNNANAYFTGIGQETVNDEYDFLYRHLHESQGRWISPDQGPFIFADPQSFNRYAYVRNSPLNLVDPLGLVGCRAKCGMFGGGGVGGGLSCEVDGIAEPCDMALRELESGAAIECNTGCGVFGTHQSPINGMDYSLLPGVNGPIWFNNANGEELDPEAANELGLFAATESGTVPLWDPKSPPYWMPQFSQLDGTAIIKAGHTKPIPAPMSAKPGVWECVTNPGDSLEALGAKGETEMHDPDFPGQIYANGNRGTRQLNPEGDTEASGWAVIADYLLSAAACVTSVIF